MTPTSSRVSSTSHDGVGPFRFNTPFFRFSETPVFVQQPPVALGEHNEYVYKRLLGMSDADYNRLVEAGDIAMEFTLRSLEPMVAAPIL